MRVSKNVSLESEYIPILEKLMIRKELSFSDALNELLNKGVVYSKYQDEIGKGSDAIEKKRHLLESGRE